MTQQTDRQRENGEMCVNDVSFTLDLVHICMCMQNSTGLHFAFRNVMEGNYSVGN